MALAKFKILDDPDKRFLALKRGMRNRISRKAARAGAKIIRQILKRAAAKLTGALRSSISVRIATSKRTGSVYAVIGPRRGFKFKRKGKVVSEGAPTKYAHLVEKGTRPHSLRKASRLARGHKSARGQGAGMHPGAKAKPFLVPAWEQGRAQATAAMLRVITAELAKANIAATPDTGE